MDIFKLFDEYEIKARYFPAIISTIPIWILSTLVKNELMILFSGKNCFVFKHIDITISLVVFFFLINIERIIGKYIFERIIFRDELSFPTTKMLLKKDKILSPEFKNKLYYKIKNDFSINMNDYNDDSIENRKIIRDIVSQIRLKVDKGKLLLQYNIQYGFFRNLYGGLLLVTPVVLINPVIFYLKRSYFLFVTSLILLLITIILFVFLKCILTLLAKSYAKRLFEEYLFLDKNLSKEE